MSNYKRRLKLENCEPTAETPFGFIVWLIELLFSLIGSLVKLTLELIGVSKPTK